MKSLRFCLALLAQAVLTAACTTGASTSTQAQPAAVEPSPAPTLEPAPGTALAGDATTSVLELPIPSATPPVLAAATSRGPDLHATDPATVRLASGGLQLVEFFRFT